MNGDSPTFLIGTSGVAALLLAAIVGGVMYGCPQYSVYSKRMDGEAELAQAEYSKRVQVQDAQGKLDSAKLFAAAEIERAKGVAGANQIIGQSLNGNEAYLRYLWINKLSDSEGKGGQVIYVPTEAGLPILEAGRATTAKQVKQ
jgi:regulator of protease activity HflC (stomatin/prohibitin superfamily)